MSLSGPSINQIDGKYRVLALLGEGGMADVSLAVARGPSGFNKLVVLKSMKPFMLEEAEHARLFMEEARVAARLNHPNIVKTNEVFDYEGLPVIVMEYLEGQSLASVVSRAKAAGGLPRDMLLKVISEALSGLHHSHELQDYDGTPLGLVHRDISPQNVFITFDGQVKVLDFGIAKLAISQHYTATGVVKGKIRYMAPEQLLGKRVDRRADVYAIGVMLWEAAAGKRMWQGIADAQVMRRVIRGQLPELGEVDAELARVVHKALALEPDARYASAFELQTDLDAFLSLHSPALRVLEVSKVVERLFEAARAETRSIVERRLAMVASLSSREYADEQPLELTASMLVAQPVPLPFHRRPRTWAVALSAAVALLALGWRFMPGSTADQAKPGSVVAATAITPAVPSQVSVKITAFPEHATLTIDGSLAPSNPFERTFARDPVAKHFVRVEAPQHRSETRELTFRDDAQMVITLERLVSAAAPADSAPRARRRRPSWKRTQVKAARAPDCDPPYYVDAQGFKKYRPQCL
jgi:eukaryotic-like serine/threonine-protein kinase